MNKKKKRKGFNRSSMRCPYCGSPVIYRSADGIYRDNSRGTMLYVCSHYPECDAYVRVHTGTNINIREQTIKIAATLQRLHDTDNAEKYIGEAIRSVQSQTYANWVLLVIDDCSTDHMKVQIQYASPCSVDKKEVEAFRQRMLESGSKRDFAIVTLLVYAGLRRSECVNLKLDQVDLIAKEIRVIGKGDKQRLVYINDRIAAAIREYLKERNADSPYESLKNVLPEEQLHKLPVH